jgi:hypothetical protein
MLAIAQFFQTLGGVITSFIGGAAVSATFAEPTSCSPVRVVGFGQLQQTCTNMWGGTPMVLSQSGSTILCVILGAVCSGIAYFIASIVASS